MSCVIKVLDMEREVVSIQDQEHTITGINATCTCNLQTMNGINKYAIVVYTVFQQLGLKSL